MSDQSYNATFVVDQTPAEVFDAITNVRGWWSVEIEGPTDELGGEFTYHYEDVHRSTMKIVELVPDQRVVWLCLANYFSFINDTTEWVGTKVSFDVTREGDKTRVRFTHLGLVPEYDCFDVCTNAWGGYVTGSLRSLITTGTGSPNNAERNAEALSQRR
jgi:Activator of Hsp90 ATPase homolog 1-like protein